MSKLVEIYNNLKKDSPDTLYLFKQGIFLISISDDAKFLSNKFGLKLTSFNSDTVKCGFPYSNYQKYFSKFQSENLDIKVLDGNILYKTSEFSLNQNIKNILDSIKNVNIDNLSVGEAYAFIEELKLKVLSL